MVGVFSFCPIGKKLRSIVLRRQGRQSGTSDTAASGFLFYVLRKMAVCIALYRIKLLCRTDVFVIQ